MPKCLLWSIAALNAACIREHPHSQYSTTTQDLCCSVHALHLTFRFLCDSCPDFLFFFSSFFWSHQMLFPNWDICSFLNKHSLLFCFNAFVQVVSYTFKAPLPILRMNFWYLSQWHAGSLGRRGVGRKHSFVTFVDVHVVNTSAMADFSLPMWGHWMQSWEEMGNNPPLQSVFNILIQ